MSANETLRNVIEWGDVDALKRRAPEVWGERWSAIRSAVERALETKEPTTCEGWSFVPLVQNGAVVGLASIESPGSAHLRSPLTLLRGPLDNLLAGNDDPVLVPRDELERLHRTVIHMQDLIERGAAPPAIATATATARGADYRATDRPRLLLVEDHADLRDFMAEALSEEWTVDVASSGEQALTLVAHARPEVVLSDLTMEGLDGAGLFRVLRANPDTADIPLILVTARTSELARLAGSDLGADDYVSKPFTIPELKARVRTQLELARVRRDATRAARGQANDFLAMVGHELRNPLSTLSTMLQAMILRGSSPELELMERAVRHLGRLVDDLLESSRLSRGKLQLEPRIVELAQVIDRATELVGPDAEARQIRLAISVPRSDCRIHADRERLARALANVITNSIQNSPRSSHVRVEARHAPNGVRLQIVDQGSGITADKLGTVFRAFEVNRQSGGLGLGLAFARSIVEMHGGTIALHSEGNGRGTECQIDLPTTAERIDDNAKPRASTRRRLLLVEDNDDAARALKGALEQLGFEVALAHDAPIAINLARTFQPDVALLDLGLPVMDGWELARRLRGVAGDLPIVAVTARDQDSDKQRSAELGFAEHLVKPIDLAQLERIVERIVAQSATS